MKLSRAHLYAILAVRHLATAGDKPVTSDRIAAAAPGMPDKFLLKVLKPLVSCGILISLKGPHGGYRLGRPAAKITLLDIVEAVEGSKIHGEAPVLETASPIDDRLSALCNKIAEAARKELGKTSVLSLSA